MRTMTNVTQSRAEVVGTRILLFTGFSNLLICKRIPGAAWDTGRRAWSYPATPQIARIINGNFRDLAPCSALADLANRKAQPQAVRPTAAPAAPTLPAVATTPIAAAQPEDRPVPNSKTKAWGHQRDAYWFVMDRFAGTDTGALLALGMGCGKSKVSIDITCNVGAELVLIVCPLRVVDVWPTQIRIHAGVPMRVLALGDDAGTVAQKMESAVQEIKVATARHERLAIVINYESLWRDPFATWALKQHWGMVICDESHRIKKPSGKASKYLGKLRARSKYRLALTGTPMPHSPLDVYGQFRFLDANIFGKSFFSFKQLYAVMGGFQQKQVVAYRNMEHLEALMRKITFRVGKEVLDLPTETHVTYHCDLSTDGMRAYRAMEKDLVAEVKSGTISAANAMVKVLRLQQITGGSIRLDDEERFTKIDDSKEKLLADTLADIGPDEPVVVFCRFRSDMDAVHEAVAGLHKKLTGAEDGVCGAGDSTGYTSVELSGRRDDLKEWQAGKGQVIAVQISAGGVGVDLTRARYNMYYSLSRSLGEYDQSLSRVHRPGQTRPVTHIHLVARGTVDEKIIRALEERAEVIESILKQIKEQA